MYKYFLNLALAPDIHVFAFLCSSVDSPLYISSAGNKILCSVVKLSEGSGGTQVAEIVILTFHSECVAGFKPHSALSHRAQARVCLHTISESTLLTCQNLCQVMQQSVYEFDYCVNTRLFVWVHVLQTYVTLACEIIILVVAHVTALYQVNWYGIAQLTIPPQLDGSAHQTYHICHTEKRVIQIMPSSAEWCVLTIFQLPNLPFVDIVQPMQGCSLSQTTPPHPPLSTLSTHRHNELSSNSLFTRCLT